MSDGGKGLDKSSKPSWNTIEALSEKAGVGMKTLQHYIRIMEDGSEEQKIELNRGEVSINAAYNNLFPPEKNNQNKSDDGNDKPQMDEVSVIDMVGNEEGSGSKTKGQANKRNEKVENEDRNQVKVGMQYEIIKDEMALRKRFMKGNCGTIIPVIKNFNQRNIQFIVFKDEIKDAPSYLMLPITQIQEWVNCFFGKVLDIEYDADNWMNNTFPNGEYAYRIVGFEYERNDYRKVRHVFSIRMVVIRGKYKGFRTTFRTVMYDDDKNTKAVGRLMTFVSACNLTEDVSIDDLKTEDNRERFIGMELIAVKRTPLHYINYEGWKLLGDSYSGEEVDELEWIDDDDDAVQEDDDL
jgi:hypothetical protein